MEGRVNMRWYFSLTLTKGDTLQLLVTLEVLSGFGAYPSHLFSHVYRYNNAQRSCICYHNDY